MIFIVNRHTSASMLVPTVWGPFKQIGEVNVAKAQWIHAGTFDVVQDGDVVDSFTLEAPKVSSAPPPLKSS